MLGRPATSGAAVAEDELPATGWRDMGAANGKPSRNERLSSSSMRSAGSASSGGQGLTLNLFQALSV